MTESIRYATPAGRWVLAATVIGSGIGFLDATVVNIALPEIGRDLGAEVSGLQWTVNAYLLTLASLVLLGGTLGDRYGRRRIFVIGVAWFAVASLFCAVAPSVGALVVARALQGVGGALLTPGSLAIIGASFHADDRARAIGAWSALAGVAAALGPFVGGWLVDAASWRWIFLINLPLAVAVIAMAQRHVPETRDPTVTGHIDLVGSAAATVALGGFTFVLVKASSRGWTSSLILVITALGVAATGAFLLAERRSPAPMLPRGIFASHQFRAANLVTFTVYAALGGVFFFLVVHLQNDLGYSPLEAGVASLPITALLLLLSPRAGALAQRIGPRLPLTVGPLVIAAGMLLLTRIEPGATYMGAVLPAIVVFGLGLAALVSPVTATALAAVEDNHAGAASAVNNAVSRIAQLLAVAVLPLVVGLSGDDYRDPGALTDAFRNAMLVTAGLAVAGAVIAVTMIRADVLRSTEAPAARHHCGIEGAPLRASPVTTAAAGTRSGPGPG